MNFNHLLPLTKLLQTSPIPLKRQWFIILPVCCIDSLGSFVGFLWWLQWVIIAGTPSDWEKFMRVHVFNMAAC